MIQLKEKIRVTACLVFDTAWRIGSGKEGETMSDLGVVLDPQWQSSSSRLFAQREIAEHL